MIDESMLGRMESKPNVEVKPLWTIRSRCLIDQGEVSGCGFLWSVEALC